MLKRGVQVQPRNPLPGNSGGSTEQPKQLSGAVFYTLHSEPLKNVAVYF